MELVKQISREQIERLQATMVGMPQAELVTTHHFSPGMYMRKLELPTGTTLVGKEHKAAHFFMCLSGELLVSLQSGMETVKAGAVFESPAGAKRVMFAVVDSIIATVHKTDTTDIDAIEAELIEPDPAARYDALNNIIQPSIEVTPCPGH